MLRKYLGFITILLMAACKTATVEPLFDQNASTRTANLINEYKSKLVGAQSGWKGAYYPNGAQDGGYSFFLKFNADGSLSMYSDIYLIAADQAFETSYQVKALQKPTLIFDTYSYLHELVNPDYNGGDGELADLMLNFESVTDTKIVLKGIRNDTYMELTKLSTAEYESLSKGGLSNIVLSTVDYVRGDKFIYLNSPNGEKADIYIDYNTKEFVLYFLKNGNVETQNMSFITTLNGIQFKEPITVFGNTFSELIWDNSLKVYYYLAAGKRVNLSEGKIPSIPFYDALGSLFTDMVFDPSIATQSSYFKNLYTKIKAQTITLSTAAPVRVIDDVYLTYFPNQGFFALHAHYTRTYTDRVDDFAAVVLYDPSLDANGNITFTRATDTYTLTQGQYISGASQIVIEGIKDLTNALESNAFSWDYDPVESKTAVLKSNTNATIVIKGKLR